MSKELAARLEAVYTYLANRGEDNLTPIVSGAIAALRSEPVEYVLVGHTYKLPNNGMSSSRLNMTGHNMPDDTPLYAAPSRESRTDRQEPGLSAETINRAKWLHEQVHERLDDKSLREEDWIRYKANLEHIYKEHFPALCDMALRSLTAPTVSEKGEQDADELLREVLDWGLPDDLKQRIDAHLARKEQK